MERRNSEKLKRNKEASGYKLNLDQQPLLLSQKISTELGHDGKAAA